MQKYLKEILECPKCHGKLVWNITEQTADRIVTAKVLCPDCSSTYSIQDEIGVFLTTDLRRNDLWEQVDKLEQYLQQTPGLEERLMDVPLDTLGPVDQYYRSEVHKARGEIEAANDAFSLYKKAIFSAETTKCINTQVDYLIEEVSQSDSPIVDLASGEGTLVRRILKDLPNQIVMTDFSPTVLVKNRKWLMEQCQYDRVSLLVFDARQTPFTDNSMLMYEVYVGLANIQNPGIWH